MLRSQGPVKTLRTSSRSTAISHDFQLLKNTINFTFVDSKDNIKGVYLCLREWETNNGDLQIYCYVRRING